MENYEFMSGYLLGFESGSTIILSAGVSGPRLTWYRGWEIGYIRGRKYLKKMCEII